MQELRFNPLVGEAKIAIEKANEAAERLASDGLGSGVGNAALLAQRWEAFRIRVDCRISKEDQRDVRRVPSHE